MGKGNLIMAKTTRNRDLGEGCATFSDGEVLAIAGAVVLHNARHRIPLLALRQEPGCWRSKSRKHDMEEATWQGTR